MCAKSFAGFLREGGGLRGQNAAGAPPKVNRRILRNCRNCCAGSCPQRTSLAVKEAVELPDSTPQPEPTSSFSRLWRAIRQAWTSIAAYLGMDTKDVQYNEEPYLIRSGLVVVTRGGRKLTRRGMDYLKGVSQRGAAPAG